MDVSEYLARLSLRSLHQSILARLSPRHPIHARARVSVRTCRLPYTGCPSTSRITSPTAMLPSRPSVRSLRQHPSSGPSATSLCHVPGSRYVPQSRRSVLFFDRTHPSPGHVCVGACSQRWLAGGASVRLMGMFTQRARPHSHVSVMRDDVMGMFTQRARPVRDERYGTM